MSAAKGWDWKLSHLRKTRVWKKRVSRNVREADRVVAFNQGRHDRWEIEALVASIVARAKGMGM